MERTKLYLWQESQSNRITYEAIIARINVTFQMDADLKKACAQTREGNHVRA